MTEIIHWQGIVDAPDLRPGELHLWRIRADARGMDLDRCLARLGERQRARAQGMRHAAYRERYIRAQAGLRTILSRYLDIPAPLIAFDRGPAGKPYLAPQAGARPIAFNLTTTGDLALVALCADTGPEAELGVDCEWIRPRVDIQAVARRMFAAGGDPGTGGNPGDRASRVLLSGMDRAGGRCQVRRTRSVSAPSRRGQPTGHRPLHPRAGVYRRHRPRQPAACYGLADA